MGRQQQPAVDGGRVWRGLCGRGRHGKTAHQEEKNNAAAQLHELAKDAAQSISSREVLYEDAKAGHGIADHSQAAGADLIIIGALGRTNLRYLFLGSTAERLLARLACSVLVIKPGEE